jgi:hypothetical protein
MTPWPDIPGPRRFPGSGPAIRRPDFLYLNTPTGHTMKFLKFVTAVALCAVFGAQARTFDEVKKDGKILMATEGQFAPSTSSRARADRLRGRTGRVGGQEDGRDRAVEDAGL